MKFKLSTLLWLVTLAGVVVWAALWVQKEKANTAKKLAEAATEKAAFQEDMNSFVAGAYGKAHYFERGMGEIDNVDQLKAPYVHLVRMPDELGGKLRSGLPFTWQWRFYLPQPNDFELCWAIHDIPPDDSFDIPEEFLHRSHLNIVDDNAPKGSSEHDEISETFLGDKPLEVIVYFRIDGDAEGGNIQVDYEIFEAGTQRGIAQTIERGVKVQLKADEVEWLRNASFFRGGYGQACIGLGIEYGYSQLPLLAQNFSLDEPLKLVKLRTTKQIDRIRYEPYPGPCLGLQVWVQKKSGPSSDSPRRVWMKFPEGGGKPIILNGPNKTVIEQ